MLVQINGLTVPVILILILIHYNVDCELANIATQTRRLPAYIHPGIINAELLTC